MSAKTKNEFSGTVRKAYPEDLDRLITLGKRSFYEAFYDVTAPDDMETYIETNFQKKEIETQLRDKRSLTLIAEIDSDPAGYGYFFPSATPVCVEDKAAIQLVRLYLRRRYYGCGVGDALMSAGLKETRSYGYHSVWLSSWELNDRANAFYKKWGFDIIGRQQFTVGSDIQNDYILSRKI